MLHTVLTDREIKIGATGESGREWSETELHGLDHINLHDEDWYVFDTSYGTDQEKYLIRFIHDNRDNLRARFDEFYLIRNEKMVTIYSFDEGLAFEPDFPLFLRRRHEDEMVTLQVFIEPKMAKIIPAEKWKQDFLAQISEGSGSMPIFQDKSYRILGVPFYNTDPATLKVFQSEFESMLAD